MELRLTKLGYKLHLSCEKVEIVRGVNSRIDERTHFILWDFDSLPLSEVVKSLEVVQKHYSLPAIIILNTGKKDSYHAYCFKACSFQEAAGIILETPKVDHKYLGLGILRGYFTLRFSGVSDHKDIKLVCIMPSSIEADLSYHDVNSFVDYYKRTD